MHDQLITNIFDSIPILATCQENLLIYYYGKDLLVFFSNFFFSSSIRFCRNFRPTIPIVELRPNRISNESAKSQENREGLDFRLVIEKVGLIVQRWKLISKIQLAAASLSRDLLSMQLDFGRNRWQLRGRSW